MLGTLLVITLFIFIGILPVVASQNDRQLPYPDPETGDPVYADESGASSSLYVMRNGQREAFSYPVDASDDAGPIERTWEGFGAVSAQLVNLLPDWARPQGFENADLRAAGLEPLRGEPALTPEVAAEVRFQKQCFLAHQMLKIHEKTRQRDGLEPGAPLTTPRNHTVIRGAPAADITSLVVSRPDIQPLLEVRPQLLSYLVPYIRLYKVYGAPRPDLVQQGAPEDNQEIEFVFETHISREDIDLITVSRAGRPGGVGLESFSWEFLGVNPAEVENNIRAQLGIHFNNMEDFERERSSGGYPYRFSDLVVPEPLYLTKTPAEDAEERRIFNPRFFRLKVVAGWAIPPSAGAERETFEQALGGTSYDSLQELIRLNKKVMYLNLISHTINFNEDGSISLNAEYQAYAEGTFSSAASDILKVSRSDSTRLAEKILDQIGDDVRRVHDVRRCSQDAGPTGGDRSYTISLPEGGRDPVRYSPGEGSDSEGESDELRDLTEDMSIHRGNAEQLLTLYERRDRALAYSSIMRRLYGNNSIYRVNVSSQALGFESFPLDEDIERGNVVATALREFSTASARVRGPGIPSREEAGLGEHWESRRLTSLNWYLSALGIGEGEGIEEEDERARQQLEVDPELLRTMLAINRFYEGLEFTVENVSRFASTSGNCGELSPVLSALGHLSNMSFGDLGDENLDDRLTANEEELMESIQRMRNWVMLGPARTVGDEAGEENRLASREVPIDFMFFGDILDVVMESDMSWIDLNNVEIFLGTFTFNDPNGHTPGKSGTTPSTAVPLAYIPISVELFSMWFLEEIVEKQRTRMTLREFIRSVFNKLIISAFGAECVMDPRGKFFLTQESLAAVPEFYTIPKRKLGDAGMGPRGTREYTLMREAIRGDNPVRLLDYEQDTFDEYASVVVYQARSSDSTTNLIMERDMGSIPYLDIAEMDIDGGIYHLNIGSDRGLVKSINFSRMDQGYNREYRMEAAGELGGQGGVNQIRERYNATVSLFGNMFFYPGQHIYINPSVIGMGAIPVREALTTKLGIGGYFVVWKVENTIARGLFETILSCSWVSSGFITAGREEAQVCETDATLSRTYSTVRESSIGETILETGRAALEEVGEFVEDLV